MKLTIGDVLRILFAPGEPEPKPSTYDEVQAANERADMLAEICEERDEDRRLEGVEWAEAVGLEPGTEPCASASAVRTAFDVLGRKPGEAIYDAARRVVKERDEARAALSVPVAGEPTEEDMRGAFMRRTADGPALLMTFVREQWRAGYAAAIASRDPVKAFFGAALHEWVRDVVIYRPNPDKHEYCVRLNMLTTAFPCPPSEVGDAISRLSAARRRAAVCTPLGRENP